MPTTQVVILRSCPTCAKQPTFVPVDLQYFNGKLYACVDCGIVAHGDNTEYFSAQKWNERDFVNSSEIVRINGFKPGKYKKYGLSAFIDLQDKLSKEIYD